MKPIKDTIKDFETELKEFKRLCGESSLKVPCWLNSRLITLCYEFNYLKKQLEMDGLNGK